MTNTHISPDARRVAAGHPLAADETFLLGIEAAITALGWSADTEDLHDYAARWRMNYLDGRRQERERVRAILEAPAAQLNPAAAWHLALKTDTTAAEAIATLATLSGSGQPH